MKRELPAELGLAVACCRWPPSAARDAAVQAAASREIDWSRFERVVARHRIVPLARDGLRRAGIAVPAPVERRQANSVAAAGRTALAMARETIRLQHKFDQAGLPALFLKGTPLAMLAFGDLGMKQSWDIDLLATPATALVARRLLSQLGYELVIPNNVSDIKFTRFVHFSKEALFYNSVLNIWVELHWRLADNPHLIPGIDALSKSQEVILADTGVRTLEDDALFAYLCAHGALHAWARLKWLADVGAFLARRDEVEVERLYRKAIGLGAGRTPAMALLLCRYLLGLALSDRLSRELDDERLAARLAANAVHCIAYRSGEFEFSNHSQAGVRTLLSHFVLARGCDYFRSEMRLKWVLAEDAMTIELPRAFAFGYYLLRVPLWLWRTAGRMVARLSG